MDPSPMVSPAPSPVVQPRRRRLWLLAAVLLGVAALTIAAPRLLTRMAANVVLQPGLALLAVQPGRGALPTSLPELLSASAALQVQATLRNRNLVEIRVVRVEWRAYLQGLEVADGTLLNEGVVLPADGARDLRIAATVPLARATAAGIAAVVAGEAKVEIRGTAHVQVLGFSADQEFQMNLPDLRVQLAAIGAPP